MEISTTVTIFFVIFSIQWYYTINRCEKETLSTTRNETSFDRFDKCIKVYSSKGPPFLIELTPAVLEATFTKISEFFIWIFDHKLSIIMFILFGLFLYGVLNRQSDVFRTASDVFYVLRDDLLKATMEISSSFQLALVSLYQVIAVVKLIEIIVIGLFLSGAPPT
ncbi:unnamed protein product, partial [Rotaria magnacalcarata]